MGHSPDARRMSHNGDQGIKQVAFFLKSKAIEQTQTFFCSTPGCHLGERVLDHLLRHWKQHAEGAAEYRASAEILRSKKRSCRAQMYAELYPQWWSMDQRAVNVPSVTDESHVNTQVRYVRML